MKISYSTVLTCLLCIIAVTVAIVAFGIFAIYKSYIEFSQYGDVLWGCIWGGIAAVIFIPWIVNLVRHRKRSSNSN